MAVSGVGVGVRPLAHWHKFHHPSTHLSAVPPNHGQTALHSHTWHKREKRGGGVNQDPTLMISSSLISVGFLLVPTLTAFLRNSLFSPAHFLPNSRESLLCEWALYRTVSVAPVGERDTASVPCVGGTLCSCDSTGSSCTTEQSHQGTVLRSH